MTNLREDQISNKAAQVLTQPFMARVRIQGTQDILFHRWDNEFAKLHNCKIEVIDHTEKTEQQELVEDLVQIITVFSCKLQGKRAHQAKKLVEELLNDKDN